MSAKSATMMLLVQIKLPKRAVAQGSERLSSANSVTTTGNHSLILSITHS
jgi:hypothetical protein